MESGPQTHDPLVEEEMDYTPIKDLAYEAGVNAMALTISMKAGKLMAHAASELVAGIQEAMSLADADGFATVEVRDLQDLLDNFNDHFKKEL